MLKEMLVKGGIIVAGLIVTEAIIEKVEKAYLKRDTVSKDEPVVKDELEAKRERTLKTKEV